MMKNFMPYIMVIIVYLITVTVVSLLIDFIDVYSFFLFIGEVTIIYIVFYSIGYVLAYGVAKIKDKMKKRRYKRFIWYYNMGLIESVLFSEPKYARNYSKNYWMRFFK